MFKLTPVTETIVKETIQSWNDELAGLEDYYSTWGYQSVLSSAVQFAADAVVDAHQYALIPLDTHAAEALVVFTHKLPKPTGNPESAIKVLQIRTHPRYDSRNPESDGDSITQRRSRVVKVLSTLLSSVLALTYEEFVATNLKIHVNKQVDSPFFSLLEEHLLLDGEVGLHFSFDSHQNWFVITKK